MKLLLVDIDDTLLNTSKFKEDLFAFFSAKYGLDIEEVKKVYDEVKHTLSSEDWIAEFSKKLLEKSNSTITYSMTDLQELTFIPNREVLSYVSDSEGKKVVFSYGNTKLQKYKLKRMNIQNIFDDIIITQGSKLSLLQSMENERKVNVNGRSFDDVTIIDNDTSFLKEVNRIFPFIKTVDVTNLIS